jgi:hypothetical protein
MDMRADIPPGVAATLKMGRLALGWFSQWAAQLALFHGISSNKWCSGEGLPRTGQWEGDNSCSVSTTIDDWGSSAMLCDCG